MMIDAHVHIHPERTGLGEGYDASVETLMDLLERSGIDKAIVLPVGWKVTNAFLGDTCRQYADKLIGFATVDQPCSPGAIEQLETDVSRYALKGLKLHPRLQDFSLADDRIVPLIQKAADLRLPVVLDTFPYGVGIERSFPLLVDRLAAAVPKARIVMAHFGGYRLWDALFTAKAHQNVFVDVSYTLLYFRGSSLESDLGFAIKKLGAHKCVYGSDHPEMRIDSTLKASLEALERYGLSSRETEDIMGNTITGLLNL